MATGDRHSIGFPVDSGFVTARHSRERASAQRDSTEVDRLEDEIEKLREQLGQYEEPRRMQEGAYREDSLQPRWIFNIGCHVALHISLKIVGHGYSRTECHAPAEEIL